MAGHSKHKTAHSGWQAERLVPAYIPWHKRAMLSEHMNRYRFTFPYIHNKIVADIACGSGYGSYAISTAGAKHVIGIDNSPEAITYAQDTYPHPRVKYLKGDATRTSLPPASVDIVISFETIEHIYETQGFLDEIKRVGKIGGRCILSTPNREFSFGNNPYHVKEFTLHEFCDLLRVFKQIELFGQRKVNRTLFKGMKTFGVPFRPWESTTIHKLRSDNDTNYMYFIAVCTL